MNISKCTPKVSSYGFQDINAHYTDSNPMGIAVCIPISTGAIMSEQSGIPALGKYDINGV